MLSGPWIRIIGFVAIATMLGMLANLLFDPGLGRADDESRRVVHPSGFSMIAPLGWTTASGDDGNGAGTLTASAKTGIGFPPTIRINRLPPGAKSAAETLDTSTATLFQGKTARTVTRELRNHWAYVYAFTRDEDGGHYEITVTSGVPQDVEHGPLRPFMDSFRPAAHRAATTTPVATAPAAG